MGKQNLAQKLAFTFAKEGAGVFYSHHDLLRHFTRSLRRASLPARLSAGFNPRPRVVFAHPLPLLVSSACEEVEIEFSRFLPAAEIFAALKKALTPVVPLLAYSALKPRKGARPVAECDYQLAGFAAAGALKEALDKMLRQPRLLFQRGAGAKRREVDARPFIKAAAATGKSAQFTLRHTAGGAGRIDELARWLALELGADFSGLSLRKTAMRF